MQQNVLIKNPCRQAHQRGQETVNSVCLNKDCLIKLACQNCLIEGQHKDHQASVCHFDHLQSRFKDEILEYKNAGIRNLINQKKQEFSEFKSNILKALTILENEAMENVEEVDQQVRELIEMTETNNYSLLKESHCKCLVALKDDLSSTLQRKLNLKIQEELMNILIDLQGMQREGDKFLKDLRGKRKGQCHYIFRSEEFEMEEFGIQGFKNYRLKYNQRNVEEINMIPIIEEQVKVLDQGGSIYFGSVKNNKIKHGRGIEIKITYGWRGKFKFGDIYEGLWLNNTFIWGQKMMRLSDSDVYLITDIIQQKENVSWRSYNGDKYDGQYKQYIKEGQGIYKYSNSERQYNDKMEGYVFFHCSNGDKYEGYYLDDKKEGKGIYQYSNGDKYIGYYKNDKKEGKGTYKYSNGDEYEGEFKDDKKEGKGTYDYKNGDKIIGNYLNDLPIGAHELYKKNSSKSQTINYGEDGKVKDCNIF